MADKRISQLIERVDIANNDVLPIVASGASTTNKVTISTIQDWMQDNLDVGVTSVGITIGSTGTDVNVTGSPITTSGNITINIPDASASARGLVTTGSQVFGGVKTFANGLSLPAVGGSNQVTRIVNIGTLHEGTASLNQIGFNSGNNIYFGKGLNNGGVISWNNSTVRYYTLPDADGTIALASQLDGYVTLNTAQTITGSKTFNSRIIGQDATLTGSGSPDTLEVFHTSGSGIAVDISKAGNGEGLRVAKTSGSGNAVTITGGTLSAEAGTFSGDLQSSTRVIAAAGGQQIIITPNLSSTTNRIETTGSLPLEIVSGGNITFAAGGVTPQITLATTGAVTLTGALNGTTASFSGAITSAGTGLNPSLRLTNTTASTGRDWHLYSLNNGNLGIYNNTSGAYSLQIASTGAATFSNNLTINGNDLDLNNGSVLHRITNDNTNLLIRADYTNSAANSTIQFSVDGNSPALTISSTGAATFSSSVTATQLTLRNNSDSEFINIGQGTSTGKQLLVGSTYASNVFYLQGIQQNVGYNQNISLNPLGGNVGIGTAAPVFRFDVETSNLTVGRFLSNASGKRNNILIQNSANWNYGVMGVVSATGSSNGDVYGLGYSASGSTAFTEVLNWTSSGNVGIGTASPSDYIDAGLGLAVYNSSGRAGVSIVGNSTTADDVLGRLSFTNNQSTNAGNKRLAFIDGCRGTDNNSAYLSFSTASSGLGTERMRITSGGFLKSSNAASYTNLAGNYHEFNNNTSGSVVLYLRSHGASNGSGILVTTPAADTSEYFFGGNSDGVSRVRIFTNGNIQNQNNSYGSLSDIKLKENIEDATPKLDDLMKVKVRNYNLIGDDKKQIGVIAQELEEVFPAMVDESEDFEEVEVPQVDEEGNEILNEEGEVVTTKERVSKGTTTKSVKYSVFVPMLIKAMQEQQEQIKSLTEQVEALKSQING